MEINAPDQSLGGQEQSQGTENSQPQVTNIDSLSEFEFQGERLTPGRLQEMFQGYRTLNEKQRQFESEDRYASNLSIDLKSVMDNPALADKFKSTYPQKYHSILDEMMSRLNPQSQQSQLPKDVVSRLSKVDSLEQRLEAMAIESANAKIDAIMPKLMDKYPLAVEEQIYNKAEAFLSQGGKMTDATWERFAKESHEGLKKKTDGYYKTQMNNQMSKGNMAKDIGPGGTPAGKSPPKMSFDGARDAMLAELKAKGFR